MKTFTHISMKVLRMNVLLQSVIFMCGTVFMLSCLNASAVGVQPTGGTFKVSTDTPVA